MNGAVEHFLKYLGYVRKLTHPLTRTHFFDMYFARVPRDFFFVQVGASDGKLADPLYPYVTKHCLAGIALEPLPNAFAALTETYLAHPQVRCVNAALALRSGRAPLYVPRHADLALSTLASLDRESLSRTLARQVNISPEQREIEEFSVETVSFADLMAREKVERVHLLQMDCEGYDWRLLQGIEVDRWKPEVINFESVLLPDADKAASRAWLAAHGYSWFEAGYDTCAYRMGL